MLTAEQETMEWQGTFCHQKEPLRKIITKAGEWEELWKRIFPGKTVPEIDFNKFLVACVFMGEKKSGGYYIEFDRPFMRNNKMIITFREHSPSPQDLVIQALTQPYYLKAYEKRNQYPVLLEKGRD
jgi:hypothetical protein